MKELTTGFKSKSRLFSMRRTIFKVLLASLICDWNVLERLMFESMASEVTATTHERKSGHHWILLCQSVCSRSVTVEYSVRNE
jgi:hypothetical protein